jgi:hypothetical protein
MIAEDLQFVTELPERAADEPALVIDVARALRARSTSC